MNPNPYPAGDALAVAINPGGWTFTARRSVPLLASARLAGIVLPSSCRNGTCRSCMCRLLEGRVRYVIEWPGLSADEKHEGWILPCVAMPESAVVIDVPRAAPAASTAPGPAMPAAAGAADRAPPT